ncbi:sugar-non-specific nuclease NucA-like protein [Adhaeribacter aerolatus]|uniref:Sugar-non-specific nuclease NucA-like protein n=1 Tax=Adhaeribacter aerolatus TaxID=670289 RepID=A0A512B5X0_9BACT|nr:DNA/RNA non-specific endonuclease [Adhaeribacter aerolatus]GEO07341.1 sugar-non-specific nuclease NucA-like protein [Adhaeribacter aerolatus]
MKYKILVLIIFAAFLGFFLMLATCVRRTDTNTGREEENRATMQKPAARTAFTGSEHLLLGNPSNATPDENNFNNYLLDKPQFALSYSRDRGTPNWVSWHVSRTWLGDAPRQDNFRTDTSLPSDWYKVNTYAYSGSGFDRGHNCPSADRSKTPEDNAATFLMTNIIPQAPTHNRETWGNMEEYIRTLVEQGGQECYIIMGSYGTGGTGSSGFKETIAGGKITVPAQIWKVVVVLPEGDDDGNRINQDTRVIAVNTPNTNNANPDWSTYLTTVDVIEAATSYDLLSDLPDEIEQVLEAKVDAGPDRR